LKQAYRIGLSGLALALFALPATLQADPAANPVISPVMPLVAEAPVALLMDMTSGQVLHAQEPDRRFVPASVTKVMSAYVAFEMIDSGKLDRNQRFTVSEKLAKEWSGTGSTMFLKSGETVSVDQLLHAITAVSANDGSVMLAEGVSGSLEKWLAEMNAAAADLGMTNSHFGTPNGWPDEGRTFTTARDLAKLAKAMIERHPQLYARYFGKPGYSHNGFTQRNHDPITGVVRGADGIKTGYTREAGYNFLGSAARDGRRLVIVVAGAAGNELRGRIARDYVEWGFSSFQPHPVFPAASPVGRARVQGGADRSVGLRSSAPIVADMPSGETRKVELSLHYRGPLKAPVVKGSRVAELEVRVDGFEPYRVPLEAADDVPVANAWQRMINGVVGLFG